MQRHRINRHYILEFEEHEDGRATLTLRVPHFIELVLVRPPSKFLPLLLGHYVKVLWEPKHPFILNMVIDDHVIHTSSDDNIEFNYSDDYTVRVFFETLTSGKQNINELIDELIAISEIKYYTENGEFKIDFPVPAKLKLISKCYGEINLDNVEGINITIYRRLIGEPLSKGSRFTPSWDDTPEHLFMVTVFRDKESIIYDNIEKLSSENPTLRNYLEDIEIKLLSMSNFKIEEEKEVQK